MVRSPSLGSGDSDVDRGYGAKAGSEVFLLI